MLMDNSRRTSPPIHIFFPTALLLTLGGLGGLFYLVFYTQPTAGPRWLFFFLVVLTLTGLALPVTAFLNRRFPSAPPPTVGVIMRQALWVGVYGATVAWLQIARVLTPAIVLLLAAGLFLAEALLRLRERSQWRPEMKREP
jgi:hypothetical protein